MKTRILTAAILLLLTVNFVSASNYRSFKMSDRMGRTMEVLVKIETIHETFEFNTREVFEKVKSESAPQVIDITPMIKPEKELHETHPAYVK